MEYGMTKSTSNSNLKSGPLRISKQERSAKALRANLVKRKSQSRTRTEIGQEGSKEKQNG